jgi:signal peptidase II
VRGLPAERSSTWWIAAAALAADQASKALVVRALPPSRSVPVIPGLLDLTLVTNTGGIFGLLRDLEGPARGLLFSAVPAAAILLMIWFGLRLPPGRRWARAALGLILGGAAGNLLDRARLGHVVDFLDVYVGRHHWPAFNVADSGICVGVAILLAEGLLVPQPGGPPAGRPPSTGPA